MIFWQTFLSPQETGDLQQAVKHNLATLLSSEAPLLALSERLDQVESSNLRFGVDCLHSISSQVDKHRFARQLEQLISAFEPRLVKVQIEVYDVDEKRNCLQFSLLATLDDPAGQQTMVFDSNINLASQRVAIEGQDIGE